jgi:L-ascorbate metabolism protein UlaG (beta-lactamase superfamily)
MEFEGRVTWLGHAMFSIESAGGRRLVLDPFMQSNPKYPRGRELGEVDVIAATHGHFDHFGGDGPALARASGATVVCVFELALWLGTKGVEKVSGMNKGGTQTLSDFTITMVPAVHSGGTSISDQNPPSDPCGYVVRTGDFSIYHAGDTACFSDMALIGELHPPDLALLPIGDFYTMGPEGAAKACELLKAPRAIPMHYGTFPVLSGTAEAFREAVRRRGLSTEVIVLEPGQAWPR